MRSEAKETNMDEITEWEGPAGRASVDLREGEVRFSRVKVPASDGSVSEVAFTVPLTRTEGAILAAVLRDRKRLMSEELFKSVWPGQKPHKEAELLVRHTSNVDIKIKSELCSAGLTRDAAKGPLSRITLWDWKRGRGLKLADHWHQVHPKDEGKPPPIGGDRFISDPGRQPDGFYARLLAGNMDTGWSTAEGTLTHRWAEDRPVKLPEEVAQQLPSLMDECLKEVRARQAKTGEPFFVSTLAVLANVDTDDLDTSVVLSFRELPWDDWLALSSSLDRRLPSGVTVREVFEAAKPNFPATLGGNLFLVTRDQEFVFGQRGSAVHSFPYHFSHASAGMVVTRVPVDKAGKWGTDLDQRGVPDAALAATRECWEEVGTKVAAEDITFCSVVANPATGTVDIYGCVKTQLSFLEIEHGMPQSREILRLHAMPLSDLDGIIRHIASGAPEAGTDVKWMPEDTVGALWVLAYLTKDRDIARRYHSYVRQFQAQH